MDIRADELALVRRLDAEFDYPGRRDAEPTPRIQLEALPEVGTRITRGDVIAGARADATGILVGWAGAGELTLGRIRELLTEAGVPADWAPRSKSARAHAGTAVEATASVGLIPRAERGRASDARYTARWHVASLKGLGFADTQVGDRTGTLAITFTLTDDSLGFEAMDGWFETATAVVENFRRMRDDEVYKAGEVTDWLRETLLTRCRAVKFGGVWYVPRSHAATAEALLETVSHSWGQDWLIPAMPVASTDAVRTGLARGLHTEAAAVVRAWEDTVAAARTTGKAVGTRAAATALARLTEIAARVRGFREVLELTALDSLRTRLEEALERVRPHLSDAAQRGAMLDLD